MNVQVIPEVRPTIVTTIKVTGNKKDRKVFNDNAYEELKKLKIKNLIRLYISHEYDNITYYDVLHYAY